MPRKTARTMFLCSCAVALLSTAPLERGRAESPSGTSNGYPPPLHSLPVPAASPVPPPTALAAGSNPAASGGAPAAGPGASDNPAETRLDIIEPNDLLEIGVADLEAPDVETPKTVRVDDSGQVNLFLIGSIKLAGLSFTDAEKVIVQRYLDASVIPKARVSLNRVERGMFAVIHSGPLGPGDLVRIEVLDLAGRANAPANSTVRILRISDAGNIGVPFLGQTRLAGFTEAEAEDHIDTAFKAAELRMRVASVLRMRVANPPPPQTSSTPPATPPVWADPNDVRRQAKSNSHHPDAH